MDQKVSPQRGPQPFLERRANSLKHRRVPLPWPSDKPFRILSLDGGGIRGIYAATILARVEKDILGGKPIADHVDMIAGTSTGGIIAIALGLGKPAAQVESLYVKEGSQVFPPFWIEHRKFRFIRQIFTSLYDPKALERLLYKTFSTMTLGQSRARLVIPAFKGPKTEIAVFKTDHHSDFKNDHRMFAWEAARSTSAAPTFFPGHTGKDYVFLDGGVWANDPIMAAVVDALSAYNVTREQIQIVSIGTGNSAYDVGPFATRGGLFGWKAIIKGAMFLTTDNAQAQATLLLGPERILRMEPKGDLAAIDLDDWKSAKEKLPPAADLVFEQNKLQLEAFFADPAGPRERFYTTA